MDIWDIGKMEVFGDVEGLIKPLKDDKDWHVRGSAAEALGRIKDARAVEPLIQALKDKDSFVRGHAAIALGGIKDARVVEPLKQARKDKNKDVRKWAKWALENLKRKKS